MDLIKLHEKDTDGNLIATHYVNPTRVVSIYAPDGAQRFFMRLDNGTAISIPMESLEDVKGIVETYGGSSGGGGGGSGGGEGADFDRPTNLNETIDAVMNLASREDEEGVEEEIQEKP